MVYDSFAHYSREAAHWAIDNTFPSSPGIATITGGVAWYSYQVGMTYSQAPLTAMIVSQIGISGYATAPLVVPWLSPIVSSYFSIGVSCCTSFTLNLIAKNFFNSDPNKEKQNNKAVQTKKTPLDIEVKPLPVAQKIELPQPIITALTGIVIEETKIEISPPEMPIEMIKEEEEEEKPVVLLHEEQPLSQEPTLEKQDVVVIDIPSKDGPLNADDPILLSDCFWKFCS